MVIARKLDRAEREFRTPQSKVRKFSHRAKLLLAHECHFAHRKPILAPCETRCENFAHHYSRCEIHFKVRKSQFKVHQFRTPQSKVRKNFRIVRNHLLAHECHFAHLKPIFAPCETRCENFAHHYSRCENFRTV